MRHHLTMYSRAVWPPVWAVGFFVGCYVVLDVALWLIARLATHSSSDFAIPEQLKWRLAILSTGAALYALYRLWRFHPRLNGGYSAWLASTPWRWEKPLPLGPIHPVWQDAVVLGVLTAAARWHANADPWIPVAVFAITYLLMMTLLLLATRTWVAAMVSGFLWPTLILPEIRGWPSLCAVAGLAAVIFYGHRKSLKAFPWRRVEDGLEAMRRSRNKSALDREIRIELGSTQTAGAASLGWPYQWLSPKLTVRRVPAATRFACALLGGWWTYCIVHAADGRFTPGIILLAAGIGALSRVVRYCSGLRPPFNIRGRLVSGRLLIPGYDRVLVTPAATILAAIVGEIIVRSSGSWNVAAGASVLTAMAFLLLSGGPSLQNWLLTGHHRCPPPSMLSNKQLLRPVAD